MHNLVGALKAELLKMKGTGIFWLSTAGTVVTSLLIALVAWYLPQVTDQVSQSVVSNMDDWIRFNYYSILPMLLPMYLVILCALSILMENRSEMWKVLYSMPFGKPVIYISKLLVVLLAFAGSHLIFVILLLLIPLGMDFETIQFSSSALLLSKLFLNTVVASLGILGLVFWVSYFSKSFVLPLAVGIIGFVIAQLLRDNGFDVSFFPFSHPVQSVIEIIEKSGSRPDILVISILYFLAFLVIGILQTKRDYR